jgi:hypothetical protein
VAHQPTKATLPPPPSWAAPKVRCREIVTLTGATGTSGAVVHLTSSDPGLISVPPSVIIHRGLDNVPFVIKHFALHTAKPVTITATSGPVVKTYVVTVTP